MSRLAIRHLAVMATAALVAACSDAPFAAPSPSPAPAAVTAVAPATAPIAQRKPKFIEFYADW